jgi:hypothetical protein
MITVPTPCHEDWNAMTPKDKGRHCDSCAKTVVDFTTWQPQAILLHFKANKNVCGRFTESQLNEPIPTQEDFVRQIAYFKIPTLKKVAAIFLFVFMIAGANCSANTIGGIAINPAKIVKNNGNEGKFIAINAVDSPPKVNHPIIKKTRTKITTTVGLVSVISNPITKREPATTVTLQLTRDTAIKRKPIKFIITGKSPVNNNFIVGELGMNVVNSVK